MPLLFCEPFLNTLCVHDRKEKEQVKFRTDSDVHLHDYRALCSAFNDPCWKTPPPSELIFSFVCYLFATKAALLWFGAGGDLASKLWTPSPPAPLEIKDTQSVWSPHTFFSQEHAGWKPIPACVVFWDAFCQIIWEAPGFSWGCRWSPVTPPEGWVLLNNTSNIKVMISS